MTTAGAGLVLVVALVLGPSGAAGNTTPLPGVVDLSVEVTAQPNPVAAGSVVEYESLIRNGGNLVAERVEGIFEIPAASVSAEARSRSCTAVGSMRLERDGSTQDQPWTVTCDVGTLPPGTETRVTVFVTTGAHGTHMSVVTVSSAQADARPSDNRVETPLFVLPDGPGFPPAFQQPGPPNPLGRTTA